MQALIENFLIFAVIGAVSFGGGYAMLPYMERQIVDKHGFLTKRQFIDVVAISQITPGPIAINSATFIGFIDHGFLGAIFTTVGIVFAPMIYMSIVGRFLEKFKETKAVSAVLFYLRPITVALIFSAFLSTFLSSIFTWLDGFLFALVFALLYFKILTPFRAIAIFGLLGIIAEFLL